MRLFSNYNKKNSKRAKKFLFAIKSLCASLAGLSIIEKNSLALNIVLVSGFILTEAINLISSDEEESQPKTS
jgi:hypothetical protein